MDTKNREEQIVSSFTSFNKNSYTKTERLNELFNLQRETAAIAFPQMSEEELSHKQLPNVISSLDIRNANAGNRASDQLDAFRKESWKVKNLISAEISGNRGERKVYHALAEKFSPEMIIQNLEMTNGKETTEIDFLVITENGVFVIEVKNTAKDVFIDDAGDQYRVGAYTRLDCKLGKKMALREQLVKELLDANGYKNVDVVSLVVFTNQAAEIHNPSQKVRTCTLVELSYLIKKHKGSRILPDQIQSMIEELLSKSRRTGSYAMDYDTDRFKRSFASAVAAIEKAEENPGLVQRFTTWAEGFLHGTPDSQIKAKTPINTAA